jgi:adenine-specific DNA-methyltransferase
MAAEILSDRGVSASTARNLAEAWVRTGDYLFDAMTVEADYVIGPPYIRLEEIPEETALLYRNVYTTMRGRADLYVAFFEAAHASSKTVEPALSSVRIAGCVISTGQSCGS